MKAITFDPISDKFSLTDVPLPKIGDLDVLVKVDACGLNPVDAKLMHWKGMVSDMPSTWVAGLDVSGHIFKIGSQVTDWKIGERVLCHGDMLRPHGGFAPYSVQSADTLIPHPNNVDAALAAATPCAGWTAWRALKDKLSIQGRKSILITGGSGGVGGFAIQIAKYFNVENIIVTCSRANAGYVQLLGATHVIDYHNEDVVARVMAITENQGVDIGLDTVGGDNDILVANALKYEGQMVALVNTVRPEQYQDAFMKGLGFHQLSLGSGHRNGEAAKTDLVEAGKWFSLLVEHGKVVVPKLHTISLEQVPEALTQMLNQRTVGKIVVTF